MGAIDIRRIIAPEDFVNHWDEKMSDEQYHLIDTFIGSSSAKIALDSMAGFYSYFFLGNKPPETDDQRTGKRVHMALLEPKTFKKRLIIEPVFSTGGDTSMRIKNNQRQRNDWILDKPKNAVIVDQDELDQVIGIVEAIMKHDQGFALIKDGRTELAGFARCPITGLGIKIKPDFLSHDFSRFSDYKTTRSTVKRKFMKDVFDYFRYDFQLAFYLYGIKLITKGMRPDLISILASEKKPPYEPAAFYFTNFELERAEAQVIEVLKKIRLAVDTNVWPFRQQQIERAKPPKFIEGLDSDDDESLGVD